MGDTEGGSVGDGEILGASLGEKLVEGEAVPLNKKNELFVEVSDVKSSVLIVKFDSRNDAGESVNEGSICPKAESLAFATGTKFVSAGVETFVETF